MPALFRWLLLPAMAAFAAPTFAAPAFSGPQPETRLARCGSGDCLLVTGRREHSQAPVTINGRQVPVDGARRWRARIPVETLRAWSAPDARTIAISVDGSQAQARLPVGMFVQPWKLTMLVITAK